MSEPVRGETLMEAVVASWAFSVALPHPGSHTWIVS